MASSPVQIANRALARLGLRCSISDLAEQSAEAAYVRIFYPTVLTETLALLDWRFASKTQALVASGTAPQPWLGQFLLPADCLTVRGLCETWNVPPSQDVWRYPNQWWMNPPRYATALGSDGAGTPAKVILCDLTQPILRYTAEVDDPSLWEPEFESALAFGLAAELALPMTGKGDLRQAMLQGRAASLSQAATNTAQGAPRVEHHTPDWLAVRG